MRTLSAIMSATLFLGLTGATYALDMEMVTVKNPGNKGRLSGPEDGSPQQKRVCGSVDYAYRIGKYEVTVEQYCEFLNAVGKEDTYGLYLPTMAQDKKRSPRIKRSGEAGNYAYVFDKEYAKRPISYVRLDGVIRFCNWLHNGRPQGKQTVETTEDGAYDLTPIHKHYGHEGRIAPGEDEITVDNFFKTIMRKDGWEWALANEDEWYKAAYHKNDGATGNYYLYPTSSNEKPDNELNKPDGNSATFFEHGVHTNEGEFTDSGAHVQSPSPYGTYDQGGNACEWTETKKDSASMVIRGGSVMFPDRYMQAGNRMIGCCPTGRTSDLGFRVVQSLKSVENRYPLAFSVNFGSSRLGGTLPIPSSEDFVAGMVDVPWWNNQMHVPEKWRNQSQIDKPWRLSDGSEAKDLELRMTAQDERINSVIYGTTQHIGHTEKSRDLRLHTDSYVNTASNNSLGLEIKGLPEEFTSGWNLYIATHYSQAFAWGLYKYELDLDMDGTVDRTLYSMHKAEDDWTEDTAWTNPSQGENKEDVGQEHSNYVVFEDIPAGHTSFSLTVTNENGRKAGMNAIQVVAK
ncbi:MAG: formylglycine-generating enzyme family protein [Candidatus Sumerlaeota bacterium]